jgi:hypothetical protein
MSNENKIGYGSWYVTQSKLSYPELTFNEYRKLIYEKCNERINNLSIEDGDMIELVYIGGYNHRKYKGICISFLNGFIHLQQRRRVIQLDITLIDDIEILEKINQWK